MEIIHWGSKIEKIIPGHGILGGVLCFTHDGGYCLFDGGYKYALDINEENIINRKSLDYYFKARSKREKIFNKSIKNISRALNVDKNQAYSLLLGFQDVYEIDSGDLGDLGEASWFCQAEAARCGCAMGYDAVKDFDEQGSMYLVDCVGKEIVKEKKEGALLERELA